MFKKNMLLSGAGFRKERSICYCLGQGLGILKKNTLLSGAGFRKKIRICYSLGQGLGRKEEYATVWGRF